MWGSDWPVVELAGGYERWRAATLALLGSLSESERARILGANAVAFYDLNRRAGGGI
jgi:L-fuconolactonase